MVIRGTRLQTCTRVIVNRCIGKILARDLCLVVSRLYRMAVTRQQSRVAVTLCLHCCCVARITVFDVAPANQLQFDPLSPGGGGLVSKTCWCGIGEEDHNERKWEALRPI